MHASNKRAEREFVCLTSEYCQFYHNVLFLCERSCWLALRECDMCTADCGNDNQLMDAHLVPASHGNLTRSNNDMKDCLGVGVRLGGGEVDGHQYGQSNDVRTRTIASIAYLCLAGPCCDGGRASFC